MNTQYDDKIFYAPDTNLFILASWNEDNERCQRSMNYFIELEKNPNRTFLLQTVSDEIEHWVNGLASCTLQFFSDYQDDLIDDFLERCDQRESKPMEKEGKYLPYISLIRSVTKNNTEITKERIRPVVKEVREKIRHYLYLFKKTNIIASPGSFEDSKHMIKIGDSGDEKHLYLISFYLANHPDIQKFNFITYDIKHLFHNRDPIKKWNNKINVVTPDSKGELC